jgi:hypothetical protein
VDADEGTLASRRVARGADAGPDRSRRPALPGSLQRRIARERLGIEADEIEGGHLVA